LPHAIKLFKVKHAGVPVSIRALHTPQIVSALALQEADVGFLFSPSPGAAHSALAHEHLADGRMVCIAPKGLLMARLLKRGSVKLADLVKLPVIGLDVLDPVGRSLNQAFREADVGLEFTVTVQTYHSALALAHHGIGVALVDSCTAVSADLSRVDVLELEPLIPVPIKALLPSGKAGSVTVRAFVRCFQQALAHAARGAVGDAIKPG
jgi:DNA-binding transcriptional LysR family regulator